MSELDLPAEVISALSNTSDVLDLGLNLTELVGDALARGFVEARWFASLCGSVTLVGQALFILDALCSIAEAGEYGDRVAESVGAAAGTVAFALKEPIPRPPADIWTADVRSAYREKASEAQQAIRDTFENARKAAGLHASSPLLAAVGPVVAQYWSRQAAVLAGVLTACRANPSESMDTLFHAYASDLVPSMGEPYDSSIRNRHYWWPPM